MRKYSGDQLAQGEQNHFTSSYAVAMAYGRLDLLTLLQAHGQPWQVIHAPSAFAPTAEGLQNVAAGTFICSVMDNLGAIESSLEQDSKLAKKVQALFAEMEKLGTKHVMRFLFDLCGLESIRLAEVIFNIKKMVPTFSSSIHGKISFPVYRPLSFPVPWQSTISRLYDRVLNDNNTPAKLDSDKKERIKKLFNGLWERDDYGLVTIVSALNIFISNAKVTDIHPHYSCLVEMKEAAIDWAHKAIKHKEKNLNVPQYQNNNEIEIIALKWCVSFVSMYCDLSRLEKLENLSVLNKVVRDIKAVYNSSEISAELKTFSSQQFETLIQAKLMIAVNNSNFTAEEKESAQLLIQRLLDNLPHKQAVSREEKNASRLQRIRDVSLPAAAPGLITAASSSSSFSVAKSAAQEVDPLDDILDSVDLPESPRSGSPI